GRRGGGRGRRGPDRRAAAEGPCSQAGQAPPRLHRPEQAGRHHLHHRKLGQGEHRGLRWPRAAHLPDRPPGQGLGRPDTADQQRRYRQRDPARRERAPEGVPGGGEQTGDRRVPARHVPRRDGARADDPAVPGQPHRQVRLPHRAAAGPEPADPVDGRGLRLPRHPAAPRAHRQHQARRAQARAVAQPDIGGAAGPAPAVHGLVRAELPAVAPRPARPDNEAERLAALRASRLLDTPREQSFDDLVALAVAVTGASMAAVSLVDAERQWFKAQHGFNACETPRDVAFCAHTILDPQRVLVVEDATRDPRFEHNPLVTGEMGIRFYAGVPLLDAEGHALGSLCVFDTRPRPLGEAEMRALQALARQAGFLIELRRTTEALNLYVNECAWYERQLLHYSELLEAQNADLARQTRTDPLTGLANRRGYGEVLGAALERAEQEGTPLSVAIVDLDHFKRVNDSL